MIESKKVKELAELFLVDKDFFLVNVDVTKNNIINIAIDSETALNISACSELSHHIISLLDREVEDYELNVSSPGADSPIKDIRQLTKAIQKELVIETVTNCLIKGTLQSVDKTANTFLISSTAKERVEGKKSKQLVTREYNLNLAEQKSVKRIISFK